MWGCEPTSQRNSCQTNESRQQPQSYTCRVSSNDWKGSCAPSNGLGFHKLQSCTAIWSILACKTRLRWFAVYRLYPQLTQAAANSCLRANAAREWDFDCFERCSIMSIIFGPRIQPWLSTPSPDSLWKLGCDIASCVLKNCKTTILQNASSRNRSSNDFAPAGSKTKESAATEYVCAAAQTRTTSNGFVFGSLLLRFSIS
jgi:hypothetical protein